MAATRKFLAQLVQHVKHVPLTFHYGGHFSIKLLFWDSMPCTLSMHAYWHHHRLTCLALLLQVLHVGALPPLMPSVFRPQQGNAQAFV